MQTAFIEATQSADPSVAANWGKFLVGRFDPVEQWRPSTIVSLPLLAACGWGDGHDYLFVTDLQTGEGAIFRVGGNAHADLDKHRIWVCPMFEPFLEWLYAQDTRDLTTLPRRVVLPDAPFALAGYRRAGQGS